MVPACYGNDSPAVRGNAPGQRWTVGAGRRLAAGDGDGRGSGQVNDGAGATARRLAGG